MHVLPTLWFRNTWTWWPDSPKPSLKQVTGEKGTRKLSQPHTPSLGIGFCIARAMSHCCSRRTRQTTSGSSARPTFPIRQRRNQQLCGEWECSTPSTRRRRDENLRHIIEVNVGAGKTATICLRLSDLAPACHGRSVQEHLLKSCRLASVRRTCSIAAITPNRCQRR